MATNDIILHIFYLVATYLSTCTGCLLHLSEFSEKNYIISIVEKR
jgi:hypothetical protein